MNSVSLAANSHACLAGIDPRAKIVVAAAFSVITAMAHGFPAMSAALGVAAFAWLFSGVSLVTTVRRLLPLNTVFFCLFVIFAFTAPGPRISAFGPLSLSHAGILLAAAIALKGNAIVLTMIDLFAATEPAAIGHAMSHLGVPKKLSLLLLLTIRYLDVLHDEYRRLRAAMRVRAFRPRMNRHTYRAFGYLAGMLLVRSFDRSERILAAMKCRGFDGRFYLLDHFAFRRGDFAFCAASVVVLSLLAWMELWPTS